MSIHILDASAMIAYANAEPGGTVVRTLLASRTATCYAHTMNLISLAQELGGEVVTSDHSEFDPLVPLGIVPINFIR